MLLVLPHYNGSNEAIYSYMLQAIRLSSLRTTDDHITPRIISLDPTFAANPYINASGLSDIDRWPEIKRALDSPPLEEEYLSGSAPGWRNGDAEGPRRGGGLNYTQTIMGPGRTGGAGMRVSGRHAIPGELKRGQAVRADSSNSITASQSPTSKGKEPFHRLPEITAAGDVFSPSGRPRAGSAPAPAPGPLQGSPGHIASSMLSTGKDLGVDAPTGPFHRALSSSQMSNGSGLLPDGALTMTTPEDRGSSIGIEPTTGTQTVEGRMVGGLEDQGSDVDEEEAAEADVREGGREATAVPDSKRASVDTVSTTEHLDFTPVPLPQGQNLPSQPSALTAALNKFIPRIVSTAPHDSSETLPPVPATIINPFYSLYSTVAAPPGVPSESLELYFPHSKNPGQPVVANVRKDATVEEVTGFGLWKYWDDGREPKLEEEGHKEERWSTVGWGLRIVEDDGEVDEDFPRKSLSETRNRLINIYGSA